MRLPEFIQVAPGYPSRRRTKKQKDVFGNQGLYSHSYGFSSSHVRMWELSHKEDWTPKNWCFQMVVLEKTLENPLNIKEVKQSIRKATNPEHWLEGLMVKLKLQYLWSPDAKSQLSRKDPDAGRDWGQEEEAARGRDGWMASPTQWSWIWASSSRQWRTERSLVCCKPRGHRESHTIQGVNNKQPMQQGTRVTRRRWTSSSGAGRAHPSHRVPTASRSGTQQVRSDR